MCSLFFSHTQNFIIAFSPIGAVWSVGILGYNIRCVVVSGFSCVLSWRCAHSNHMHSQACMTLKHWDRFNYPHIHSFRELSIWCPSQFGLPTSSHWNIVPIIANFSIDSLTTHSERKQFMSNQFFITTYALCSINVGPSMRSNPCSQTRSNPVSRSTSMFNCFCSMFFHASVLPVLCLANVPLLQSSMTPPCDIHCISHFSIFHEHHVLKCPCCRFSRMGYSVMANVRYRSSWAYGRGRLRKMIRSFLPR